jgi:ERF superfamily protein
VNSTVLDLSKVSDRREIAPVSDSTALISVIERASRDPNIDIDKMERLLVMQEKIFARAAEADFNAAMSACQAEMPIIKATFKNDQTNSFYAALEEIDRIARPIYTRHGFALSFGTTDCPLEGFFRQTCKLSHRAGHSEWRQADLPTDMVGIKGNPNKTGIQGFGSTMTYGQRYITKLAFNIVIGDDNDGNGPTLSKDQVGLIEQKLKDSGTNRDQFFEWWRIKSLDNMPAFNFPVIMDMLEKRSKRVDPRGDLSDVDMTLRDKRVSEITDLAAEYGSDEQVMAKMLQDYHEEYLQPFPELFIAVNDKLAKDGIISKQNFKKLLSLVLKP